MKTLAILLCAAICIAAFYIIGARIAVWILGRKHQRDYKAEGLPPGVRNGEVVE